MNKIRSLDFAICRLRQRVSELSRDRAASLDHEMHNRIREDNALIQAYQLSIEHLSMEQRNLEGRTLNPIKWIRRTVREALRRLRPIF